MSQDINLLRNLLVVCGSSTSQVEKLIAIDHPFCNGHNFWSNRRILRFHKPLNRNFWVEFDGIKIQIIRSWNGKKKLIIIRRTGLPHWAEGIFLASLWAWRDFPGFSPQLEVVDASPTRMVETCSVIQKNIWRTFLAQQHWILTILNGCAQCTFTFECFVMIIIPLIFEILLY